MGKKLYTDLDLRKNKLLSAKVEIADREAIENDDVIDKQYVNDEDTYVTALSDPLTGLNSGKPLQGINGITTNTVVHGKSNRELFDMIFYPVTPPTYVQPTLSISRTIVNQQTEVPISAPYEVGTQVRVNLVANTVLNDSQGLNGTSPYTWSGIGISGNQTTGSSVYSVDIDLSPSNTWQCIASFLGSAVKNNSHGLSDSTGIFGTVSKTANSSLTAYWPYWIDVITGDVPAPTNSTELRQLTNKNLAARPTTFNVTFPGDSLSKTLVIAVPATNASISAIKDGAQPIAASAWTKVQIANVPSLGNSGQTQNYTVFRHNIGIGFSTQSVYSITISY